MGSVTDDQWVLPGTDSYVQTLRRFIFSVSPKAKENRTENFSPLCFEERIGHFIYSLEEWDISKFHQMI